MPEKIHQIGNLPFEEQERVIAWLRAQGALTDAAPKAPMPCGHTENDLVTDELGAICCGACAPVPYGPVYVPSLRRRSL